MKNENNLQFKTDKGMAGLTILLSTVAMIFVIGFLLLIFVLIGTNLGTSTQVPTTSTVNNETGFINASGYTLTNTNKFNFRSPNIVIVTFNNSLVVPSSNYTVSSTGVVTNTTATAYATSLTNITYTYISDQNSSASNIIFSTSNSLSSVTSWFPIIITITVMTCLILLTVIIIVAIRSTGLLGQGQ